MAYSGHKKEDIEDTSMERHWPPARPAKAWNPFGQLPPPRRGGGEEESAVLEVKKVITDFHINSELKVPTFQTISI
jgi:hypothetical protein